MFRLNLAVFVTLSLSLSACIGDPIPTPLNLRNTTTTASNKPLTLEDVTTLQSTDLGLAVRDIGSSWQGLSTTSINMNVANTSDESRTIKLGESYLLVTERAGQRPDLECNVVGNRVAASTTWRRSPPASKVRKVQLEPNDEVGLKVYFDCHSYAGALVIIPVLTPDEDYQLVLEYSIHDGDSRK